MDHTGTHDVEEMTAFQDWYLRYWLSSVDGVAEVATVGGYKKQYQVTLEPEKLLAHSLPVSRVIAAIRDSNSEVGGRTLEMAGREYFIRGRAYIDDPEELETVTVGFDGDGTPVHLRDVARAAAADVRARHRRGCSQAHRGAHGGRPVDIDDPDAGDHPGDLQSLAPASPAA
ncbi:MAG: efflux RND transporter permease subunit [Armatimonadota bacterium]|nr:efflux RND transporter permease subunit [Armatimonadota bacterium]